MLIAFDIDGTLADITHRLHFLEPKRDMSCTVSGISYKIIGISQDKETVALQGIEHGTIAVADVSEIKYKKNWDSFNSLAIFDKPIREMCSLCASLLDCVDHDVIFVSGRREELRKDTLEWLTQYLGIPPETISLYMRPAKDRQQDYVVKRNLMEEIHGDFGKYPDIVFDDRQQVVDMWRENDIRCCQVAPGNF